MSVGGMNGVVGWDLPWAGDDSTSLCVPVVGRRSAAGGSASGRRSAAGKSAAGRTGTTMLSAVALLLGVVVFSLFASVLVWLSDRCVVGSGLMLFEVVQIFNLFRLHTCG